MIQMDFSKVRIYHNKIVSEYKNLYEACMCVCVGVVFYFLSYALIQRKTRDNVVVLFKSFEKSVCKTENIQ